MADFVIVHGAWGGGWEWSPVADILRAAGHRVFTPTLAGLGDRAHLATRAPITLETHVADILAVLDFERLDHVVLCAASYGGLPATVAADRRPGLVRLLVYVDGLVPVAGEPILDLFPAEFAELVRTGLAEHGPAWRVPMPGPVADASVPVGSLPDEVRDGYLARLRDHPALCFTGSVQLSGAIESVPRAFIRCTSTRFAEDLGRDPVEPGAARARLAGWPYHEIAVPHDPQLFDPAGIAGLLGRLAE